MKFNIGRVVATPKALEAIIASGDDIVSFLIRHVRRDWGDLDQADRHANEHALVHGLRLLSAYHLSANTKISIITEADRSSTTILLPSEY